MQNSCPCPAARKAVSLSKAVQQKGFCAWKLLAGGIFFFPKLSVVVRCWCGANEDVEIRKFGKSEAGCKATGLERAGAGQCVGKAPENPRGQAGAGVPPSAGGITRDLPGSLLSS